MTFSRTSHFDSFHLVQSGQGSPSLFPSSKQFKKFSDAERDARRPGDWEQSVIDYLHFMSGAGWRRGRTKYRESPSYLWYLGGIRLMASLKRVYVCDCENCRKYGHCFGGPVPPELTAVYARYGAQNQMAPAQPRKRWIDCPEAHFASCRCARCRSRKARESAVLPPKKPVQSVRARGEAVMNG